MKIDCITREITLHIPLACNNVYIFEITLPFYIRFADLQDHIEKSYTPKPEVVEVTEVHDVKEWMIMQSRTTHP